AADLERMTSTEQRRRITEAPRALIEDAWAGQSPTRYRDVAGFIDRADRQAPRHVVRVELVEAPAARAEARFVQQARRQRAVPDPGPRLRHAIAGPLIDRSRAAVDAQRARRHTIHAERHEIDLRRVKVDASVVLLVPVARRAGRGNRHH